MMERDCGCIPEIHPGETHFEHEDRMERESNNQLLDYVHAWLATGDRVDGWKATILLHRIAELELVRLERKRYWLEGQEMKKRQRCKKEKS